ncbi:LysM peptidoglycan-binding domain-containing protein [Metabacillus sp. JX24]|uniref:LysM peptidoglycan-binding domain-containing protein n=1 Tax=Metabacillus sp. JX24 TaxID=3240759 RepID=UPI00350E99DB
MSRMERAALAKKAKIEDVKSRTGSYPSRSEIHKKKEKKKSPYKYPAVSLLAIFFFLLPIGFYYTISYFDERSKTVDGENISDYEDVLIKYGDDEEQETEDQSSLAPDESDSAAGSEDQTEKTDTMTASADLSAGTDLQEKEPDKKPEPQPKKEPKPEPAAAAEPNEKYRIVEHTVGPEDNLYRISVKYYGGRSGEDLIKQWNQLSGDSVFEGQVLKIPLKQ